MDALGGGSSSTCEDGPAKSRRRRSSLLAKFAVVGLAALVLVLLPAGAGAVHGLGLFQLDGNTVVDQGVPGDDWNAIYANGGNSFSHKFIGASDEAPANDTTYFTSGGSKDVNDIDEWEWAANDVSPDKNQILDAYAAAYVSNDPSANGHTILYFGMDRFDTNGDSNVGFWFVQDKNFDV